jgi:hypothetical protein
MSFMAVKVVVQAGISLIGLRPCLIVELVNFMLLLASLASLASLALQV